MQDQAYKANKLQMYPSRTLKVAEQNYNTMHRGYRAIVWAILLQNPHMEGQRLTTHADHDAFKWVINVADSTGRLARWRLRLFEFNFDLVHKLAITNKEAYASSKLEKEEQTRHSWRTLSPSLWCRKFITPAPTTMDRTAVRTTNSVYLEFATSPLVNYKPR